jgi:hypothetical protein
MCGTQRDNNTQREWDGYEKDDRPGCKLKPTERWEGHNGKDCGLSALLSRKGISVCTHARETRNADKQTACIMHADSEKEWLATLWKTDARMQPQSFCSALTGNNHGGNRNCRTGDARHVHHNTSVHAGAARYTQPMDATPVLQFSCRPCLATNCMYGCWVAWTGKQTNNLAVERTRTYKAIGNGSR